MDSVCAVLCANVVCFLLFVLTATANSQSRWCPSLEMKRVTCLKNVSLDGGPPTLRRVYRWKKEMVIRCCPGFMGPTCQKACFSCRQWAEVTGRIHHIEQFLARLPASQAVPNFLPYSPDQSANVVCWSRDGRPLHGEISPDGAAGGGGIGGGPVGGGAGAGAGGSGGSTNPSPIQVGVRSAYSNGCPIYGSRADDGGLSGGPYSIRQKSRSPYFDRHHHHNQQQHQQLRQLQQKYQQQQQYEKQKQQQKHSHHHAEESPISITVTGKRSPSHLRPPHSQGKPEHLAPGHSRASSESGGARSKFKAAEMVVSLDNSQRLGNGQRQDNAQRLDNGQHLDTTRASGRGDVPVPTDQNLLDELGDEESTATQVRLSILESQMSELEEKLSALGPALSSLRSLQDQLGRLYDRMAALQAGVQTPESTAEYQKETTSSSNSNKFVTGSRQGSKSSLSQTAVESDGGGKEKDAIGNEDENIGNENNFEFEEDSGVMKAGQKSPLSEDEQSPVQQPRPSNFMQPRFNRNPIPVPYPNIDTNNTADSSPQLETENQTSPASEANNSTSRCQTSCNGRHSISPPPLPDEELIKKLFSNSSSLVTALKRGSRKEFYHELKKALHRVDNTSGTRLGGIGNSSDAPLLVSDDDTHSQDKNFAIHANTKDTQEDRQISGSPAPLPEAQGNVAGAQPLRSAVNAGTPTPSQCGTSLLMLCLCAMCMYISS